MRVLSNKLKSTHGFTLGELLIVLAIIVVLVSISIPIFTSKLEKSREAVDASNIRTQYASVMADGLLEDGSINGEEKYGAVQLKQHKDGWQSTDLGNQLESIYSEVKGSPKAGGTAWVEYNSSDSKVILHYEGEGATGEDTSESEEDPDAINENTKLPNYLSDGLLDWNKEIKDKGSYTIKAGYGYTDGESVYFGARNETIDEWNLTNKPIGTFADWYWLSKYTGRIINESDFGTARSDLTRGDLCKVGHDYYVFTDGGTWSEGPVSQPSQWVKLVPAK